MSFPTSDTAILRDLATRYAAAAAEPINAERHAAWNARNKLQAGRPLLHIYQVPWQEFPDCAPQCTDPLAREVETRMRRELWQWNHFPGDMVLPRSWPCPMAIDSGHFGIKHAIEDSKQDRGAVHYNSVVHSIDDIALITDPVVSHDATESQRRLTCLEQAFGDIMPVVLRGIDHGSISAWDAIIHFYSIDDLMMDMIDRPKFVHALVLRYTEACLAQWRQLVDQGLVTTSDGIYEIGNGGLAICDQLPGFDGSVRPCTGREIWGRSMAQIFSDVSPAMHEEFALRYEIMWLEQFGRTAYGCCEPLHHKVDLLRSVPNLRRISVSPWANKQRAAEAIGTDYIYSLKPNPADMCAPSWDPAYARRQLEADLEASENCHVEVILKDVHTLHNQPERLDQWEQMARELIGAPSLSHS